jgi:cell division protease FtsH
MVTEFGMSPRLGRMYYSESQRSPFLAGSGGIVSESIHAEATLREIDLEVRRLVDDACRLAMETLTAQRETLEKLAADLMEMETMSAEHMQRVIEQTRKAPRLMVVPSAAAVAEGSEDRSSSAPVLTGGDGLAEGTCG